VPVRVADHPPRKIVNDREETAVSAKTALIVLTATIIIFAGSVVSSLAGGADKGDRLERGGAVVPCSLDGINPVHHPDIFGNPAVARSYGFVLGPDRAWHVAANCRH
jgi:hypothetical protein